jgi:hypothetical protein
MRSKGRPESELHRSAQREGSPIRSKGRPESELHRSAQREGSPIRSKGRPESELHRSAQREGSPIGHTLRLLTLGAAVTLLASGCALQDTRYDYSRNGLPFADYDESILDWNFPTTTSQGPLLPPERLQPWRPAIGVPWANGNPMPWYNQLPVSDAASEPSAGPHDSAGDLAVACDDDCAAKPEAPLAPRADADARVRGDVVPGTR